MTIYQGGGGVEGGRVFGHHLPACRSDITDILCHFFIVGLGSRAKDYFLRRKEDQGAFTFPSDVISIT